MNWIYKLEFREGFYNITSDSYEADWLIEYNQELEDIINKIRQDKGFTDLPKDEDNEVYYDYYLLYSRYPNNPKKNVGISVTVQQSEKDDKAIYDIPLTDFEEMKLLEIAEKMIKEDMIEDGRSRAEAIDVAINSLMKGEK